MDGWMDGWMEPSCFHWLPTCSSVVGDRPVSTVDSAALGALVFEPRYQERGVC